VLSLVRFLTFADGATARAGVLRHGTVHPLPAGVRLVDLLGDDGTTLREAGNAALGTDGEVRPYSTVRLLAPIPDPPTVRDFMTFESHFAGARGLDNPIPPQWYEAPAFYFTNPYAVIGPDDPVPIAPGSSLFDLELEVAAVVGRAGRDLSPDEAEAHIAGYTMLVDWSARDLQFGEMQVGLGPAKAKDTATTLGPVLVTPDELDPYRSGTSFALTMTPSINNRPLGEDRMDSMAWSFGELLAYASRGTEVRPGDIIGSGTCGGGCLVEMWGRHGIEGYPSLQPGDEVTVSVQEIGTMTMRITGGVAPVAIPRARQ
jgi:2-keto-4-pentenoate hydratase/2-oxohepta-3-ene-1,7-dioic acid hydratase in catechol pathway